MRPGGPPMASLVSAPASSLPAHGPYLAGSSGTVSTPSKSRLLPLASLICANFTASVGECTRQTAPPINTPLAGSSPACPPVTTIRSLLKTPVWSTYSAPRNRFVSPGSMVQLVSKLEPLAEAHPICPPTPVPKYMSPAVKPLVETLTVASLISSTMLLVEVQVLIVLLLSIRTKLLVAPSGQFTETISELLLGL